jgi:hypothetical protein
MYQGRAVNDADGAPCCCGDEPPPDDGGWYWEMTACSTYPPDVECRLWQDPGSLKAYISNDHPALQGACDIEGPVVKVLDLCWRVANRDTDTRYLTAPIRPMPPGYALIDSYTRYAGLVFETTDTRVVCIGESCDVPDCEIGESYLLPRPCDACNDGGGSPFPWVCASAYTEYLDWRASFQCPGPMGPCATFSYSGDCWEVYPGDHFTADSVPPGITVLYGISNPQISCCGCCPDCKFWTNYYTVNADCQDCWEIDLIQRAGGRCRYPIECCCGHTENARWTVDYHRIDINLSAGTRRESHVTGSGIGPCDNCIREERLFDGVWQTFFHDMDDGCPMLTDLDYSGTMGWPSWWDSEYATGSTEFTSNGCTRMRVNGRWSYSSPGGTRREYESYGSQNFVYQKDDCQQKCASGFGPDSIEPVSWGTGMFR